MTRLKNSISIILKTIRIKHWIKNILIFVPILFSLQLFNIILLLKSLLAFVSFSFCASFIYIINDLIDIEKDKLHPIKKNRPIASGLISVKQALLLSIILISISLGIGFYLNIKSFIIIIVYVIINILYSMYLKNIPIIDVSIIALGFILRILIGGTSTYIPISKWLLLTIMTLSFYLGFGKRRNEIKKVKKTDNLRKVLKEYTVNFLDKAMNSMMTLSITFYSLWSIDPQVTKTLKTDKLLLTVPLVVIGMFRYSLIIEKDSFGDPTDVIFSDKLLHIIILLFIIVISLILY